MESQTALLVQRRTRRQPDLLSEFKAIAASAGYSVLGTFDIVGPPSARFGISSGKVEEIATLIEVNSPDVVLFSPSLRSSQVFRLMERWDVEVRDRNQVILEIFDNHARTPQAKLQIEQARLEYELPFERQQIRIRLQHEHTGDRPTADQVGAGEDLLTKKMSEIRHRIGLIEAKLQKISEIQELKRKRRANEGFLEVAIAGYTNAGKSTLHHALTGSGVEIADNLFTTLATKTARLESKARQIVLSDSVGFISDLPDSLLRAFNTTLMEITDADVIILVVDGSDLMGEIKRKLDTCLTTFADIGANGIPVVLALNKIDLLSEEELSQRLDGLGSYASSIVSVSAQERINLDYLVKAVEAELPALFRFQIHLPYGDEGMSLLSWIHEMGAVRDEQYTESCMEIDAELSMEIAQKLMQMNPHLEIERVTG
jgi:GTP-binding protein HflX